MTNNMSLEINGMPSREEDFDVTVTASEVRKWRDELHVTNAINSQNEIKAKEIIANMEKIFNALTEAELDYMESNGIPVRSLLSYDLKEVHESPEVYEKFMKDYRTILLQIRDFVDLQRGVK